MPNHPILRQMSRRAFIGCATVATASLAMAQQPGQFREPVYRVSKAKNEPVSTVDSHPLDPALDIARKGLEHIRANIRDYTCTLVKRERIKGELNDHEFIHMRVRNRQYDAENNITVPFSVYMYFMKPAHVRGREVIYVEGRNNGKLCAHEGGTKGKLLPTVWLQPDSMLAMQGQLYPITEVGIENLVLKLIERGTAERKHPDVEVNFKKNAKVNDRVCTVLEIRHPTQRPEYEFYLAQVFIDDEMNIPIRYAAYGWPDSPKSQPPVLEEYTYLDIKVNVGLTDYDFDPKNENYNF